MKKLLAPGGPLGIFGEHPILLRLAAISVCAEVAWATLLIVLQFHIKDDFSQGVSEQRIAARIATVSLAFVGCEALFKIPMGHLSDRIGPRPLILFALGLCVCTPVFMFFARDWWQFIPLRAIDGLGAAALWPAMSSLMARSVPREAKAAAMSIFNGAYCLGLAVGPIVGLLIGHNFGNKWVFPLCSLLMGFGIVTAWLVLRDGVGARAIAGEHSEDVDTRLLRGRPMLVRMLVLYALSQSAVGLFVSVGATYVDRHFGISEGDLPKLIAAPALFVALIAVPLGRLGDSIGRARAVKISYVFAALGMVCVALTSLLPETTRLVSPQVALFSFGLLGLVASYILGTPAWLSLTSLQVDESKQGRVLSLMQFAQGVGVVIGFAVIAFAGQVLARWQTAKEVIASHLPRGHFPDMVRARVAFTAPHALDPIPIEVWLWAAALVFALCLLGTMRFVHENAAPKKRAEAARQPLETTGL